jgi:hypothetical protein
MRPLLACLALALAAAGCDTSPAFPFEEEVVVTSVLVAGLPLPPVTLTRTVPLGAFYEPIPVTGATVTVALLRADGTTEATYPYVEGAGGAYVSPDSAAVRGGGRYRLEVAVPGEADRITAETTVPTAFELVEAPPDTVVYQEGQGPAARVTPSTFPGRQTIYLFTVRAVDPLDFRREADASTPATDDSVWVPIPGTGYDPTPFVADLILDRDVDPENFWTGNSPLLNEGGYDPNPDGSLTIRLPWLSVNYFGPTETTITAFDDALVRFFETQTIQTVPTTISPGEIPNVDSNVENGRGVFGAVAQVRATTFVRPPPVP